jgi:predicted CoA-binding protein
MVTRASVDRFLACRSLAVVGASRKGNKFGNTILKELARKGYEVFPVHPEADRIDGRAAYPRLESVAGKAEGAVIVVPPAATEKVVAEAADAGITKLWLQQGAESEEAIRICRERGIDVVFGECILMFAEPAAFIHRVHRWINGVMGKLPHEE